MQPSTMKRNNGSRKIQAATEGRLSVVACVSLSALMIIGCSADPVVSDSADLGHTVSAEAGLSTALCEGDEEAGILRPSGWTSASHCKGIAPDYDLLFDDNIVHRFDITIEAAVHQQTLEDLNQLLSGGGPGGTKDLNQEPMWVPVHVKFGDKTWDMVGMRYKGNSSLRSAWQQGQRKLAFRFNFDKFEDDHPELQNQRFYGFKKITFSNGFKDSSLIRDKLAADIFRAGGIPAARGAFARVYLDHGEGPVYMGLYTMIEDPSDEMLGIQFGDDSGNLYKPEGEGAKWGQFVEEHFIKSTNEEAADWSDIKGAIAALQSTKRGTAPAAWRTELEQVFDVYHFLRLLALNQAMENWDSYGLMTHNYYVYADPSSGGVLKWIPWDLNEALMHITQRGSTILMNEIGADWPLIRYLLDDEVYRPYFKEALAGTMTGAFSIATVQARAEAYHALVAPYVSGQNGEQAPYTLLRNVSEFDSSVAQLMTHVTDRHTAIEAELQAD